MSDAEHMTPAAESPAKPEAENTLPDGIGLTMEQVQKLLAKAHKTVVDDHDPILMVVTILNAHLGEVEKL